MTRPLKNGFSIHEAVEAKTFWVIQFRHPNSELKSAREFLILTMGNPWLFTDRQSGLQALAELREDQEIKAQEIELRLVRYAPAKEVDVL